MTVAPAKFRQGIDAVQNQIINRLEHSVATLPTPGAATKASQVVLLTTDGAVYVMNQANTAWVKQLDAAAIADVVTRSVVASAVNELMVSGGADRTAQSFTTDGIIKVAAGVVANAIAGTDFTSPTGTEGLSNKTFNTNIIDAAVNTLSNIGFSALLSSDIETDLSVSASALKLATAAAVKAYIDAEVAGLGQLVGGHDASTGVPTTGSGAGGAIQAGDRWYITVAGTITGVTPEAVLEVGDQIVAKSDGASVGADFFSLQANLTGATTTTSGYVELATQAEAEAKTDTTRAVTAVALTNFSVKALATITGDGTTALFSVVHNLNKELSTLDVRLCDPTTEATVYADVKKSTVSTNNQFDVEFSPVLANLETIKVVIHGG